MTTAVGIARMESDVRRLGWKFESSGKSTTRREDGAGEKAVSSLMLSAETKMSQGGDDDAQGRGRERGDAGFVLMGLCAGLRLTQRRLLGEAMTECCEA